MSDHPKCLSPHESVAVSEYARRLHQTLSDKLVGLWLFGSKARGDSDSDSDIDLLVVLKTVQSETQWHIWDLGSDVSLEYDVLLNAHIIDAARWADERQYRGTLWREIERDGVPLQPEISSAPATAT
jgi:predicted nucleotidyltransferase